MTDKEQQRREECRRETRGYLAIRAALSFEPSAIRRRLNMEGNDFTVQEVFDALMFLVSAKHVDIQRDPDGATQFYRITAEGTLAYERRNAI